MQKMISKIVSNMPTVMLRVLKYLLYIFVFISILVVLTLSTRTGTKLGYLYLNDTLSKKSHFDIKVTSVNLYSYPQVSASLLIEDIYSVDIEGEIEDFKKLDLNYTISSSQIKSDYDTMNDEVEIKGVIAGPFENFLITGNGRILDGSIAYEGLRKRHSVDNINIGIADLNTTKFLRLLGVDPLINGKSNAHIHFDTFGRSGKIGKVSYDLKDDNFSGMPAELKANVNILDDDHNFSIHLTTPTSTLDMIKGTYNRELKTGTAEYILNIKELSDLEKLLGVEAKGPFLSTGKILYDQKIKVQGVSESFGGILDILYEQKKFHFKLNNVPFNELMNRLTYSPLLDAKMQGEITYDRNKKEMYTKVDLKDVKLIQKDMVKVIKEKFDYDVNNEVFNKSSFEARYKEKILTSKITIANDLNHFIFKDTQINAIEKSIDTDIDFKIDKHLVAGKLFIRNDGHEHHTLDSFVRFDGVVEEFYKLKLNGALSDTWTNMDYTLSSSHCTSHICTIIDDVDITGHLYGPLSRLLIRGEGVALEGHVEFEGVKSDDTFKNVNVYMDDIHAKKLYTLLGEPTLPHGKATLELNLEFVNSQHKKGTLNYTLKDGIYSGLPLDLKTHVTIKDNLFKFTGDLNLNGSTVDFTDGVHDSDEGATHAFYKVDIKDLTTLELLFGHTYNGPFYAMGTIGYDGQFLIRGLTKSLGGITDFLYKQEILYVDFKDTSLKDLLHLFSYPTLLDAKANGSVNYYPNKDLILVSTKLNDTVFLQSEVVENVYKQAGIYLPDEIFDQSTLEFKHKDDIISGNIKLENKTGHIYLTDVKIDTDKKMINAGFDVLLQERAINGKIYGPLAKPKVNLNFQKFIRHEMDKQLDSVVGKGNRKMMDSMPMGEMPKDVASGMGGAFVDMFF